MRYVHVRRPPDPHSCSHRYDGDVYQALLDMAQGSPLNATEEGPAWPEVLKPVLAPARSRAETTTTAAARSKL